MYMSLSTALVLALCFLVSESSGYALASTRTSTGTSARHGRASQRTSTLLAISTSPATTVQTEPNAFGQASVVAALEALKAGKMIVVTDDESRENEGDFIMAGEFATPETIGFIVRYSSGVICCSVPGGRIDALQLPPMYVNNEDPKGTAFTVSVDYKKGTTTGISAADRAATFRALADPESEPSDFQRPGHVFPLRPKEGGVLERDGHTEAAIDYMRLAGLKPCGVLCEIVNEDGSMARVPELEKFCQEHELVLTSIADLQAHITAMADLQAYEP
jgi:3,4-dihydroxy-2-butanone 4-phosphate synthase